MNTTYSTMASQMNTMPDFDALFAYLEKINRQVDELYSAITSQSTDYMTTKQAAAYLGISTDRLYHLVNARQVPVSRQGGKLMFSKAELHKHYQRNAQPTQQQLQDQASERIKRLKEQRQQRQKAKAQR